MFIAGPMIVAALLFPALRAYHKEVHGFEWDQYRAADGWPKADSYFIAVAVWYFLVIALVLWALWASVAWVLARLGRWLGRRQQAKARAQKLHCV